MGRFDKLRQALRRQTTAPRDDKDFGELNRGERMTTTAAADKEKLEKRRALGRGLESLLPGPRVVTIPPAQGSAAPAKPHFLGNDHPEGAVGEGTPADDTVFHGTAAEPRPATSGLRPGHTSLEQDIAIVAPPE